VWVHKKVAPVIVPRTDMAERDQRGNTEIVSVVLKVTSLVAEDLRNEIRPIMGPFGEVTSMAGPNQLVLQDSVGNLKQVIKTIKDYEDGSSGQAETFTHQCKYILARNAKKTLDEFLLGPQIAVPAFGGGDFHDPTGRGGRGGC